MSEPQPAAPPPDDDEPVVVHNLKALIGWLPVLGCLTGGVAGLIVALNHVGTEAGGLYLIGYCHLRQEPRMFAVERIKSITPTERPYQIPLHFDFEAFVEDSLTVMRGPRIDVELEFDKPTAAWAKHRVWHPSQELKRLPGGKLRITLSVADSRELVGWILSFGSGVRSRWALSVSWTAAIAALNG